MTYNKEKPDSGFSPALDASIMQGNFAAFASILSTTALGVFYNHMPMNKPHQGEHASIILTKQTADPGVTGDNTVLYCKDIATNAGTQPQLFVQIPKFLPTALDTTEATNAPMQLTYNSVNTAGPQYQSFLPGGYILYFGTTTLATPVITLIPGPTAIVCAMAIATSLNGTATWKVSTNVLSSNTFQIYSNANNAVVFNWMAVAQQ